MAVMPNKPTINDPDTRKGPGAGVGVGVASKREQKRRERKGEAGERGVLGLSLVDLFFLCVPRLRGQREPSWEALAPSYAKYQVPRFFQKKKGVLPLFNGGKRRLTGGIRGGELSLKDEV